MKILFWCLFVAGLAYFLPGFLQPVSECKLRCRNVGLIRGIETLGVLLYFVLLLLGEDFPFSPDPRATAPLGVALTLAGVLLNVWARRSLQSNFTVTLGIKQDHELITTGPYAWVRHPIYTGFLLQFLGAALVYDSGATLLFLMLPFFVFFYWQSAEEEKLLVEHFGDAYRRYRVTTGRLLPKLLPGGPHG
jgi:protein-S-isoprenylcysteine O-methyltransferase Ste14